MEVFPEPSGTEGIELGTTEASQTTHVHGTRWDGSKGDDVIMRQLSIILETLWGLGEVLGDLGVGNCHTYLQEDKYILYVLFT